MACRVDVRACTRTTPHSQVSRIEAFIFDIDTLVCAADQAYLARLSSALQLTCHTEDSCTHKPDGCLSYETILSLWELSPMRRLTIAIRKQLYNHMLASGFRLHVESQTRLICDASSVSARDGSTHRADLFRHSPDANASRTPVASLTRHCHPTCRCSQAAREFDVP